MTNTFDYAQDFSVNFAQSSFLLCVDESPTGEEPAESRLVVGWEALVQEIATYWDEDTPDWDDEAVQMRSLFDRAQVIYTNPKLWLKGADGALLRTVIQVPSERATARRLTITRIETSETEQALRRTAFPRGVDPGTAATTIVAFSRMEDDALTLAIRQGADDLFGVGSHHHERVTAVIEARVRPLIEILKAGSPSPYTLRAIVTHLFGLPQERRLSDDAGSR